MSALQQTWADKEVLVVDDGSTDNTLGIAKQYESETLKVFAQENKGVCAARNLGLRMARGDYFQWLDADDLLAPDKLARQLEGINACESDRVLLTSAYGTFFYDIRKANFTPNSLWGDLTPTEWLVNKFRDKVWMNPATWLISRRLTEIAGPWNENILRDNDGEYICRVVSKSHRVKFVPKAHSYYRIGNLNSVSKRITKEKLKSMHLATKLCINYLLELEDTPRSRSACNALLQHRLFDFYPEHPRIVNDMFRLAVELGGRLNKPSLNGNHRILQKLFGFKTAKEIVSFVKLKKFYIYSQFDRMHCSFRYWFSLQNTHH